MNLSPGQALQVLVLAASEEWERYDPLKALEQLMNVQLAIDEHWSIARRSIKTPEEYEWWLDELRRLQLMRTVASARLELGKG